jgi:metal-responsive CopG/Arc/MetJ family transcriptional regulator
MTTISLRLPDALDTKLAEEAQREGRMRSEVARDAIAAWLQQRQRERLTAQMVSAARELGADTAALRESCALADDLAADGLQDLGDELGASHDPARPWWK